MNPKINFLAAVAAATLANTGSSRAATLIDASAGINFGSGASGNAYNYRLISLGASLWTTTGMGLSNVLAPVGQFMGQSDNGTAIPFNDLVPLKTSSLRLTNAAGTVRELAVDGSGNLTGALQGAENGLTAASGVVKLGGTLTGTTTITQAGHDVHFEGANTYFKPDGVPNPLIILTGDIITNPRLFSAGDIEIQTSGNANQLKLTNLGRVGIGVSNPLAALHVASVTTSATSRSGNATFFYADGATNVLRLGSGSATESASILAEGSIATRGNLLAASSIVSQVTVTFSDQRVKDVTGVSNSQSDLDLLNKIAITDYTMKDKVTFGNKPFKKVIAQQVESVFPQAVDKMVKSIPDVMRTASATRQENGNFKLTLPPNAGIKIGDRLEFVFPDNTPREIAAVLSADDSTFTVSLAGAKDGGKVFIYGHEVNDFRTVDYDALSMLNISATQELAKKVAVLETENADLKELAVRMKRMEALIATLEKGKDGTVTVALTK